MRIRIVFWVLVLALLANAHASTTGPLEATTSKGAGVTIIVHGWNPDGNQPVWMDSMASAIVQRNSGMGHIGNITVSGTKNNLTATCGNCDFDLESQPHAEVVMLVNWTAVANHLETGVSSQEVAAVVAPLIYEEQNSQPALSELPIHLIGHSRGGGMVFEIARLLGLQGIDVDHLTALDPHPLTASDPQSPAPPLGVGPTIDTPINIHENILFVDNYWQNIEFPTGQQIDGAYNREFSSLPGGYHNESGYTYTILGQSYNFSDHLNIILAYHATIKQSTPASNGEATITETERAWFNDYEQDGSNAGFIYSRIAGQSRTNAEEPVSGGNAIVDGLHNDILLEGNGHRQELDWSNAQWTSILSIKAYKNGELLPLGYNEITLGDELEIKVSYRNAGPGTRNIAVYTDRDRNPYNGSDQTIDFYLTSSPGEEIVEVTSSWTVSNVANQREYYLLAKVLGDQKNRILYAPYEFKVQYAQEVNNALHFIEPNRVVRYDAFDLTEGFTMEAWVQYDSVDVENGNRSIISTHHNDGQRKGYAIEHDNSTIKCVIGVGTGWKMVTAPVEKNKWFHVAFSYVVAAEGETQNSLILFINGEPQDSVSFTEEMVVSSQRFSIGGSETYGNYFSGTIDEVRIWDVPQSYESIHANHSSTLVGNEEGLLVYYNFDQGEAGGNNTSVTRVFDKTNYEHNGHLLYFALTGESSNWITSTYPMWEVSFNGNEHTAGTIPEAIGAYDGEFIELPLPGDLVKTDYRFNGWNTQANGEGQNYHSGDQLEITSHMELFANWLPDPNPPQGEGTEESPYEIASLEDLLWMSNNLYSWNAHFVQVADIDASATSSLNGGEGFRPIGNSEHTFSGTYNGQSHTITGLYINNASSHNALFGVTSEASLSNIHLIDADISGTDNIGCLVGKNEGGTITYASCSGAVTGTGNSIGGLIGENFSGLVKNSYAKSSVTGVQKVGGLVGNHFGSSGNNGVILNSYSIGTVTGDTQVGGFVGTELLFNANIENCYYLSDTDYRQQKTLEQFTNGAVAWLLQAEQVDFTWGHTVLDADEFPRLSFASDAVARVFESHFVSADPDHDSKDYYFSGGQVMLPHLEKPGYSLAWMDDAGNQYTEESQITENTSLTAQWTEMTYEVTTWPIGSSIVYGDLLAESVLSGGVATIDGEFGFVESNLILNAGIHTDVEIVFTPEDLVNYSSTAGTTTVEVAEYPVTVTAESQSIFKGEEDPELTYTATPLLNEDQWSGTLVREPGDTVGIYAITQGTLDAGLNYAVTFVGADFEIMESPVANTMSSNNVMAFTGRASAKVFNLQGQQVWSGMLDIHNGLFAMPDIGAGHWVLKIQMGNEVKTMNVENK